MLSERVAPSIGQLSFQLDSFMLRRSGSHLPPGFPLPSAPLRTSAFLRTLPSPCARATCTCMLPLMLPHMHPRTASGAPPTITTPTGAPLSAPVSPPRGKPAAPHAPTCSPTCSPALSLSAACALPATNPLARLYPTRGGLADLLGSGAGRWRIERFTEMDAMAISEERPESSRAMRDGSRVTVGVLSKWVHIGRGWAPRLFLLRQLYGCNDLEAFESFHVFLFSSSTSLFLPTPPHQRHLLYFKLRGSSTAAMIRKLQQQYDHVALIGRAVSDLVGDYNEGVLCKGEEEGGGNVGEGGDEEGDEEDEDEGEGEEKGVSLRCQGMEERETPLMSGDEEEDEDKEDEERGGNGDGEEEEVEEGEKGAEEEAREGEEAEEELKGQTEQVKGRLLPSTENRQGAAVGYGLRDDDRVTIEERGQLSPVRSAGGIRIGSQGDPSPHRHRHRHHHYHHHQHHHSPRQRHHRSSQLKPRNPSILRTPPLTPRALSAAVSKLLAASPRRSPLESCGYGGGRMEGGEGEEGRGSREGGMKGWGDSGAGGVGIVFETEEPQGVIELLTVSYTR
ncbi:unnamed protein product [Closterium sp. NIES-54]